PRPAAAQRARSDPHAATRPALTHLVPTWSVGTRKMPQIPFAFWFSVIRISFVLRVSDFEILRRCTMRKWLALSLFVIVGMCLAVQAAARKEPKKEQETYLNAEKAGPDFAIQGEYTGEIPDGGKLGAQ